MLPFSIVFLRDNVTNKNRYTAGSVYQFLYGRERPALYVVDNFIETLNKEGTFVHIPREIFV